MGWYIDAKNRQRTHTDIVECQAQHKQPLTESKQNKGKPKAEDVFTDWENANDDEAERERILLSKSNDILERKRKEESERLKRESEIERFHLSETGTADNAVAKPKQKKKRRKPKTLMQKITLFVTKIFGK